MVKVINRPERRKEGDVIYYVSNGIEHARYAYNFTDYGKIPPTNPRAGGYINQRQQQTISGSAATDAAPGAPNVDQWAIAGVYNVRGFRVGGAYIVDVDEWHATNNMPGTVSAVTKQEDMTQWFLSGKYSQDNWSVAAMYGKKNTSDAPEGAVLRKKSDDFDNDGDGGYTYAAGSAKPEDETVFSVGGNVTVGKVGLAVLHDSRSDTDGQKGMEKTVTAFSATYNFTARSRVWVAYIANEDDTVTNEDDEITIGMRMDF